MVIPNQTGPDLHWSGHETMQSMRSHSCLRTRRRTLEVSVLRAPLHAGDRVDGKPLDGWHQASFAGTLRSGRAGVPQRFRALASAPAIKRFYRLVRACCAYTEELRSPSKAPSSATTIGGARHGKRGWVPPVKSSYWGSCNATAR